MKTAAIAIITTFIIISSVAIGQLHNARELMTAHVGRIESVVN